MARHGDLRDLGFIFDSRFGIVSATDFIGGRANRIGMLCFAGMTREQLEMRTYTHVRTRAEDERRVARAASATALRWLIA